MASWAASLGLIAISDLVISWFSSWWFSWLLFFLLHTLFYRTSFSILSKNRKTIAAVTLQFLHRNFRFYRQTDTDYFRLPPKIEIIVYIIRSPPKPEK